MNKNVIHFRILIWRGVHIWYLTVKWMMLSKKQTGMCFVVAVESKY